MAAQLTLRQIRVFLAVARYRSFTTTAARLHVSQPAITASIKQLESNLGAPLLDRSSRQVTLTAFGESFLTTAERLVGDFDSTIEHVKTVGHAVQGHVFIACPTSLAGSLLIPLLNSLAERGSDIFVSLREDDGAPANKLVRDGGVDFALTGAYEPHSSLTFFPLLQDGCCVVVPKKHPLAKRKNVAVSDLSSFPLIAITEGMSTRRLFDRLFDLSSLRPHIKHEVAHLMTVFEMVHAGIGIAILPMLAARLGQRYPLAVVPISDPILFREVGLVANRRQPLSAAARLLWDGVIANSKRIAAGSIVSGGSTLTLPDLSK